ncbi:hypothetical protein M758_UG300500 [Ceratodon purpureus]|nr:hypothetical protein M758_UG300500 [Ceratodon purpureus]
MCEHSRVVSLAVYLLLYLLQRHGNHNVLVHPPLLNPSQKLVKLLPPISGTQWKSRTRQYP